MYNHQLFILLQPPRLWYTPSKPHESICTHIHRCTAAGVDLNDAPALYFSDWENRIFTACIIRLKFINIFYGKKNAAEPIKTDGMAKLSYWERENKEKNLFSAFQPFPRSSEQPLYGARGPTLGSYKVVEKPTQAQGEHANMQKGPSWESNPEPSCCEVTVLTCELTRRPLTYKTLWIQNCIDWFKTSTHPTLKVAGCLWPAQWIKSFFNGLKLALTNHF